MTDLMLRPFKLHEKLTEGETFLEGIDYFQNNIPQAIQKNLNPNFELRSYQLEAFGRFKYYMEKYPSRPKDCPTHVLYHMATGSGKTLIMAGLILYLYHQGYRNFLFFVNNSNIIDKTRHNFLNPCSIKYLFNETIQIAQKKTIIKEVANFQGIDSDCIHMAFTTIQGLHSQLNVPKENSLTFDDFEHDKIVLISDEAHHINATTKKMNQLSQGELFALNSWEATVERILKAHSDNMLLEFTATIDFSNQAIKEKYCDKIIFDYPLKNFRQDGYSKEVKLLQADMPMLDRCLQAIMMNQYRRKLFEKNGLLIKPVILFKSKTIQASNDFYQQFIDKIANLNAFDLRKIKNNANKIRVLQEIFNYFSDHDITLDNLSLELKEDFSEDKCIVINSKDESDKKQIDVNTLEDSNNEYRAIFAVDKLNEGWDVLNLFDIVRLYDTRDSKGAKIGKTTISEAQLIGRGARLCPFQITEDQEKYKRKYDADLTHPLRLCEELYYHSPYNSRYIEELNRALEEIGIKAKTSRELPLWLKEEFKQKPFYKAGFIFKNKRKKCDRRDITGLKSSFIETIHKISLPTGHLQSSVVFDSQTTTQTFIKKCQDYHLVDFGLNIMDKALRQFPDYEFSNLKRLYPHLTSIKEFITSANYLGNLKITVEGSPEQINHLSQDDKLFCAMTLLEKLRLAIQNDDILYQGSTEFEAHMVKDQFQAYKKLNITNDGTTDKEMGIGQKATLNDDLRLDLSNKDWFPYNENYGTATEKHFLKYFDSKVDGLKKRYDQVYLLRNERFFKLYNFNDGKPFEPDFVLFLIKDNQKETIYYQIFIEPKGKHLLQHDAWKEAWLKQLHDKHKIEQLWQDKQYIVWGLPFYNETETKYQFDLEFNKLLNNS